MIRANSMAFPPFRLDTVNECLWRERGVAGDERIHLAPKAYSVLRHLIEHAGRLVTEDELLAAAWPKVYVQPEAVKTQIHQIRKILADDSKAPRFIETVARRGYQFIAPLAEAFAATGTGSEPQRSRFVGRQAQLTELGDCLQRTLANRRQIVFVTGETGIGKTTLADECVRRAAAKIPGLRIARGQCIEGHGSREPYYAVLEAVGELCRGPGGATLVQILAAHAPSWLVQFPDLVSDAHRASLKQELLGATRDRMLREIGDALEIFSADKPLLLVLEDLHWADPSTVDLISTLARHRGSAKLMLVGTYRPVDVTLAQHPLKAVKQDLLAHQLCREIALPRLTQAEVGDYLEFEAPGAVVPEGVTALLYRYSEGNPLFLVATLDHLRQRGLIGVEDGAWRLAVPPEGIDFEAPESLRQLIELQIERLSAEERRVLEIASAGDNSYTAGITAFPTSGDCEIFERVCEDLARRELMLRRPASPRSPAELIAGGYEFSHALYRDVFYRRQAPARRTRPRGRLGEQVREAGSLV